jgi:hypothetical protein
MVACEKCGIWQHIKCLQKSGQVEKTKSMDNVTFICQKCENKPDDIVADVHQHKKPKTDYTNSTSNDTVSSSYHQFPSMQSTWQPQHQPSAVRGNHPPMTAPLVQHVYYPPSISVLPPIRATLPPPPQQQQQYPYYPTPSYPQIHAIPNYSPSPGASVSMTYQHQQQSSSNFAPISANTGRANMTPPSAVQAQYQPTASLALPNIAAVVPITNSLPVAVPTQRTSPHQPTIQSMVSQSNANATFVKENNNIQ